MGNLMHFLKLLPLAGRLASGVFLVTSLPAFATHSSDVVTLDAEHWQTRGDAIAFIKQEGFPQGLMVMKSSSDQSDPVAVLKGVQFSTGTIEFDVKPDGGNWPTVRFRKADVRTAEEFYVRPSDACAASADCTQYAPMFNGRMLWDTFYKYQHSAPFRLNEWNHIKMVISGQRMNVYFNREAEPSLKVGELMGQSKTGALEFQGPATFANLSIRSGDTAGLPSAPELDPTLKDAGYLRRWQVTSPLPLPADRDPVFEDAPPAAADWQTVRAERFGLVDLARLYGMATTREVPVVAWSKTTVRAAKARFVPVSVGFARRIVVFVDGKLIYSGHNLYNLETERRPPDGRLSIENGSFKLPLQQGDNQIMIGLSSNSQDMRDQYSFGFEFLIEDPRGLTLLN